NRSAAALQCLAASSLDPARTSCSIELVSAPCAPTPTRSTIIACADQAAVVAAMLSLLADFSPTTPSSLCYSARQESLVPRVELSGESRPSVQVTFGSGRNP